ncbi:hypothetical protein GR255_27675, partial [Mycobacterium tuberculosis]|nr:hypothetical protein [Mycobacterium tuberculosis]
FSLRLLYTAVNQSTVSAAVLATCVALMLAFWLIFMPWLVEVLSRGRSLGRLVMGLRIVRDDGKVVLTMPDAWAAGTVFSLRLLYTAVNQSTVSAAVLATCVALMLAFWL